MEIILQVACILLSLVAGTHAQPNLAAIWGLGALGNLGEGRMGGMSGLGGFNSLAGMNSGSSSNSNCPYQAHPNQFKFTQVVNNRVMTQECAPGTMFVLSKCSCDNIPTGGVPRPGSNPRLDVASLGGGGGNSLINALVSQLQGGGSNPRLSVPPPVRNKAPPPMTNHINNGVRPRVSSGRRPDQSSMSGQQASAGIQYNPGSSSGLTSVVDPAILPKVLPPQIMQILKASSGLQKAPVAPNPTQTSTRRSTMGRKPSAPTPTQNTRLDVSALAQSGIPPEVLKMLQRSMGPPTSTKTRPSPNSNMPQRNIAPAGSNTVRRMVPSPTRATRPRTPSLPIPRTPSLPLPKPTRHTNIKPQSGHRQDPLAALLASSKSASRSKSSSSRAQPATRRTNTPQTNPFAAMMASLGGNSRSSSSRTVSRPDPMAALMASMAVGSSGSGSSNNAMMAALLGGSSSGSGGLRGVGGPLDVTSLTGNVNAASLLGETPGPGLVQNVDMTALFNAQGQMGAGGGMAGLAGLNNINMLKLQQLDSQGVLDIGDLTPMGMAAANAYFG